MYWPYPFPVTALSIGVYSWEFNHWRPSISAAITKYLKVGILQRKKTVSHSFGDFKAKELGANVGKDPLAILHHGG